MTHVCVLSPTMVPSMDMQFPRPLVATLQSATLARPRLQAPALMRARARTRCCPCWRLAHFCFVWRELLYLWRTNKHACNRDHGRTSAYIKGAHCAHINTRTIIVFKMHTHVLTRALLFICMISICTWTGAYAFTSLDQIAHARDPPCSSYNRITDVSACSFIRYDSCNVTRQTISAVELKVAHAHATLTTECAHMYSQYLCIEGLKPCIGRNYMPSHVCAQDCIKLQHACQFIAELNAVDCSAFATCDCFGFNGELCLESMGTRPKAEPLP
jgi:hypothetical protein